MYRRAHSRADSRGQSLAEFALVFPFFMVILFGVIEFAFALNALLAVNFATREGALAGAEAGNSGAADCSILRAVEGSVGAPADRNQIVSVRIYLSKSNGDYNGSEIVYRRDGGSLSCPLPDGTPATLPYTYDHGAYTSANRCSVLKGCPIVGGGATKTVDTIGVEMTYDYTWKTPLSNFIPMAGNGYTLTQSNAMRMEPVL